MTGKYINARIDPPRRVEILRTDSVGYWKPGQFGYAVAYSTHPGMHTMDKGPSEPGDLSYLVSKSKDGRGGALWFSAQGLRFTGKEKAPSARTKHAHATKGDRRKIRYVQLGWSNPPGYSKRFVEGNFPESDVMTILEGLLQRGVPEVNVEGRDFALTSLGAVYEAANHARDSVSRRRR